MENVDRLMEQVNSWVEEILGEQYVGVYFHGSLRLGSFNPAKSDLDFIIVVKGGIDLETRKKICDCMMENRERFPAKGFEFSVVQERYCREIVYPTPFELHMSGAFEELYRRDPQAVLDYRVKEDPDLASHFHVINVPNDRMDFGKASSEVFSQVPGEYVFASNWSDIENAEEDITANPVYVTLNLCRFYAYIREGLTLSKYDGGKYALAHMPSSYPDIIQRAMEDYRGEGKVSYPHDRLAAFAEEAMKAIKDCIGKSHSMPWGTML